MWCIKQLDQNKDRFIKTCLSDINKRMDDTQRIHLNILFLFLTAVVLIGGLVYVKRINLGEKLKKKFKEKKN